MYEFLKTIEGEPMYIVMFAGFHAFGLLILLLFLSLFYKLFGIVVTKLTPVSFVMTVIVMIGWLLGFVTQMLLFFMEVPGLKMLLIYVLMYFVIATFTITNREALRKQFDKFQEKSVVKKGE